MRRLGVDPLETDVARQSHLNIIGTGPDDYAYLSFQGKRYRIRISPLKTIISEVINAQEFWDRAKAEWQLVTPPTAK